MSVYRVVDKLETTVKESMWLPFGARIVNQDRMLDLIEKLRSNLPEELGRAKALIAERDRLLAVEQARPLHEREQARPLQDVPADSEIVSKAQQQADAIIAQARATAKDIRRGADEYADQVLAAMDASLGNALAAVKKGRQTLASGLSASNGIPRAQQRRP